MIVSGDNIGRSGTAPVPADQEPHGTGRIADGFPRDLQFNVPESFGDPVFVLDPFTIPFYVIALGNVDLDFPVEDGTETVQDHVVNFVGDRIGTERKFHGVIPADLDFVIQKSLCAEASAGVGVRRCRTDRHINVFGIHRHADKTAFVCDKGAFQFREPGDGDTGDIFVFGNDPVQFRLLTILQKSDGGFGGIKSDVFCLLTQICRRQRGTKAGQ